MSSTDKYGYVAIIGRPNVGKSTLLNRIIGSKISITSQNSQTTRGCVSGNFTGEKHAVKIVDTPGYVVKAKHLLDKALNKSVTGWIESVDLLLFVIDARQWTDEDSLILKHSLMADTPMLLVLNKVDLVKDKEKLLPFIEEQSIRTKAKEVVPISASKNINIDALCSAMLGHMPDGHPFEEQILLKTPIEIIIAERIREKIFRYTSSEIPRNSAVKVIKITSKKNVEHIKASIIVARKGQRKIVIGKKGEKLKEIGTAARLELEKYLNKKIYLELYVEVEDNWSNKENLLSNWNVFYNQQY